GDPVGTTFEVTPLKIGNLLYLCTPHQSVIALDATTGEEVWRYDPQIRDELALQHLTCRGLSYYDAAQATAQEAGTADDGAALSDTNAAEDDSLARLNLPVAAEDGRTSEQCGSKLFMPTAD